MIQCRDCTMIQSMSKSSIIDPQIQPALQRDQPSPNRAPHRIGPVCGAELAVDRRDMEFHGLVADGKPSGDRLVGQSFGKQFEHLDLARRQRLRRRLVFRALLRCYQNAIGLDTGGLCRGERGELAGDLQ
jgi:hypothetical protein